MEIIGLKEQLNGFIGGPLSKETVSVIHQKVAQILGSEDFSILYTGTDTQLGIITIRYKNCETKISKGK